MRKFSFVAMLVVFSVATTAQATSFSENQGSRMRSATNTVVLKVKKGFGDVAELQVVRSTEKMLDLVGTSHPEHLLVCRASGQCYMLLSFADGDTTKNGTVSGTSYSTRFSLTRNQARQVQSAPNRVRIVVTYQKRAAVDAAHDTPEWRGKHSRYDKQVQVILTARR